jgi:hypothetical protein
VRVRRKRDRRWLPQADRPNTVAAGLLDGEHTLTASGGRPISLVVQRAAAARAIGELPSCVPQLNG